MAETCFICGGKELLTRRDVHPSEDAYVCECIRCGRYVVDRQFANLGQGVANLADDERLVLSAAIREATDLRPVGLTEIIDEKTYQNIAARVPRPRDALDQLDLMIDAIASRTRFFGEKTPPERRERWAARMFMPEAVDLVTLASALHTMNLITYEAPPGNPDGLMFSLKIDGWKHARDARRRLGRGNQAFVAMWFHKDLDRVFDDAIMKALDATGYAPYRVDREHHNNKIDDEILAQLRRSRLVVADATGGRPSVYFEAGFAEGLGVKLIWCCNDSYTSYESSAKPNMRKPPKKHAKKTWLDRVAFDTRQNPFVLWRDVNELRTKLTARIQGLGLDLTR
jgi:hypothetical protein